MPRKKKVVKKVEEPKVEKKETTDVLVKVSLCFPNKEPFDYSYTIKNGLNAIPRTKQNVIVFQKAMYEGLCKEIGRIVGIKL